jgi:uncharacterized protein (TIGR02145 family)
MNGKPYYSKNNYVVFWYIQNDFSGWIIRNNEGYIYLYYSTDVVDTPDLVSEWNIGTFGSLYIHITEGDLPVPSLSTDICTTTTTTIEPTVQKCYGLFYNHYVAEYVGDGSDSAAPIGFHIPLDTEWETLGTTLGGLSIAGAAMKEVGTVNWAAPNTGATNSSGFTALPVGNRGNDGSFYNQDYYATWWSASETIPGYGKDYHTEVNYNYLGWTGQSKNTGAALRAIKDDNVMPIGPVTDYDGNVYTPIQVGSQIWLLENLITTHTREGVSIPNVTDNTAWASTTNMALSAYENNWVGNACIPEPPVAITSTTSSSSTTTTTTTLVSSTTTTSTTSSGIVVAACSILFNTQDDPSKIYAYDPATQISTLLTIPGITVTSADIAHTANKLWIPPPNQQALSTDAEWNITLNPFTATFNRNITNLYSSAGLCAINDTTLITVLLLDVYESNISTSTAVNTFKFSMIAGRRIAGDYLLTTNNKFIVTTLNINNSNIRHITQYSYPDGAVEVDIDISAVGASPYGIYEYNNEIYIGYADGKIYKINKTSPYATTLIDTLVHSISGASQLPSCLTVSFIP